MSLAIKTTKEIKDDIVAQISSELSASIPLLPKAFTPVLAAVLAATFVLLFKYGGFLFLQLFVAYASDKETTVNGRKIVPLIEYGRQVGVGDPLDAQRAELVVDVTVKTQVGELSAGVQLVRTETGFIYIVVAAKALNAATIQVTIRAISSPNGGDGSGTLGNLQPGDIVEFANPIANVGTRATVVSQAVTGADAETSDRYRVRILDRIQKRPQGGAYADYKAWGEEVPGILHIYPYAGLPGQVDVYVEAVPTLGNPDGDPTLAQLDAVKASIQLNESGLATRRPVSAAVNVAAVSRKAFDVRIANLAPDTPTTRSAIREGVAEYLSSREPFIVGISSLPRLDRVTQAALAGIVDTIVSANGATISGATLLLSGVPIPAYTLTRGEKSKLNADPTYV